MVTQLVSGRVRVPTQVIPFWSPGFWSRHYTVSLQIMLSFIEWMNEWMSEGKKLWTECLLHNTQQTRNTVTFSNLPRQANGAVGPGDKEHKRLDICEKEGSGLSLGCVELRHLCGTSWEALHNDLPTRLPSLSFPSVLRWTITEIAFPWHCSCICQSSMSGSS